MWCYDAYFVTNYGIWRHSDLIRDEVRVIAQQLWFYVDVFSPLRIHSLFSRLNTPKVWPYMVMWREIWIYLITSNSTPFHRIEMGFSSEIIEFYAENYYQTFNTSFLNFLSDAEFGHSRWRHNSSHMGWNKHQ